MENGEVSFEFGDPKDPQHFHIDIAPFMDRVRLWISGMSNHLGGGKVSVYSSTQYCYHADGATIRKLARALLAAADQACGPEKPQAEINPEAAAGFADVEAA